MVILPQPDNNTKIGYEYDAFLEYIQDDVKVKRRIGK